VLGIRSRSFSCDIADAQVIMMDGSADSAGRALWTASIADLGNHRFVEQRDTEAGAPWVLSNRQCCDSDGPEKTAEQR